LFFNFRLKLFSSINITVSCYLKDLDLAIILAIVISFIGTIVFAFKKRGDFLESFKLILIDFKKSKIIYFLILAVFCILALIIYFKL